MYIYTRVKETGTTPKRCHSKGLWYTNTWVVTLTLGKNCRDSLLAPQYLFLCKPMSDKKQVTKQPSPVCMCWCCMFYDRAVPGRRVGILLDVMIQKLWRLHALRINIDHTDSWCEWWKDYVHILWHQHPWALIPITGALERILPSTLSFNLVVVGWYIPMSRETCQPRF